MVRRAVPDDAARIALIQVETWQSAYQGILAHDFLDSLQPEPRTRWWDRFLRGKSTVHVSEGDGEVVGFCSVGPSGETGWGEVFAIYVHPDWWRAGHGRQLLEAGETSLLETGFTRAHLWVLKANERARGFYEARGWTLGPRFRVEEIGGVQVTEVRYETGL
ncbi:MAG: GNAT family N-acetyltransferase [Acidimicrobiia bacterium]